MVKTGPTITLGGVIKVLQKNRASSGGSYNSNQFMCFKNQLFERPQCDGLRTFSHLLCKYFESNKVDLDNEILRKMQISNSDFISAHKVPSLEDKISSNCVVVENSNKRFLRRIVAVDSYHGCSLGRFDAVMIKADVFSTEAGNKNEKSLIWFAKVLIFVRVNWSGNVSASCPVHNKSSCSKGDINWSDKLAFL